MSRSARTSTTRNSSLIYGGTSADVDALALTALARYKINQNFSVHGGLRLARFGADVILDGTNFTPISGYSFEGDDAWGVGGVVGVAYEKPEIAARVILTYSSEITFDLDTKETFPAPLTGFDADFTTELVVPQSVNLDFQTGVAKGTLLFGQIRWVNWDGFEVRPESLDSLTGQPLTFKDYNVTHYKLGIGRQFNPTWAGALQINYTPDENNLGRILDVVDGNRGLSASATYTAPSGIRVTGAAGYVWFGNSTLRTGVPPNVNGAEFADNHGVALLLKVQYSF